MIKNKRKLIKTSLYLLLKTINVSRVIIPKIEMPSNKIYKANEK